MVENAQLSKRYNLEVTASTNLDEIKLALSQILYVPYSQLKSHIIEEILDYLASAFSDRPDTIMVFIAYKDLEVSGYVSVEIHPGFKSRNRKCATFGWLHAVDCETCKLLLDECEEYVREHNIKLIRGNINFPKAIGGIGIQESGFEEQMLYGVAFNDPASRITEYLERLGYKRDADYVCMEVTHGSWKLGKKLDKNIKIRYLSNEELRDRKDQLNAIARNVFYSVLPDAFGEDRFEEIMNLYAKVPQYHYKLPETFNPHIISQQPEFLEAWESCNLEKVNTLVHMAFTRETEELVGIILCLPDKYQLMLNKPITRINVDTVMLKEGFSGKGIFSSLNNIGQLTGTINGIAYYEGTGIWMMNEDAIRTILPHGKINRRFFVWQKRLKKQI